jgi:hypothetical protein
MNKVNISDRAGLRRAYPPEAFAEDAAQNSAVATEVLNGVRILRAPDAAGEFELERGSRQVGETTSAAFLTPYRRAPTVAPADSAAGAPDEHEAFLDDIVDAARQFGFRPQETPGQGDPRIRGLRQ